MCIILFECKTVQGTNILINYYNVHKKFIESNKYFPPKKSKLKKNRLELKYILTIISKDLFY